MTSILRQIVDLFKPSSSLKQMKEDSNEHKKRPGKKTTHAKDKPASEVLPIDKMTKADFEAALNDVNWSIEAYQSELEMTDVMSERYTELLELIEIAENERNNIQDNIELLSGNDNNKTPQPKRKES